MPYCEHRTEPPHVLDIQDLPTDWPTGVLPLVGSVAMSKCSIASKDFGATSSGCTYPGQTGESCSRARRVAGIGHPGPDLSALLLKVKR